MLVKLPIGRDPERSLLKVIRWQEKCSSTALGIHRSEITPNPPGKPSFPCIYSGSLCTTFLYHRTPGLLATLPAPSAVGCSSITCPIAGRSGKGGCSVALGMSSSSVPSLQALEQNPFISSPISKYRCRRGRCIPVVTHQQSSPLPKTP